MKITTQIIAVSLLAYLPACAAVHRHRHAAEVVQVRSVQTTASPESQSNYDSVRNAEVIKRYYAGEYIDPNNPSVRHDGHLIQRVEQAASWNLHPSEPVVAGGPTYVAAPAGAQRDAISAQLSGALDRQKGYAQALAEQNEKLQQIIEELRQAKENEAQAKTANEAELKLTVQTLNKLKQEIQKAPVRPFPLLAVPPPMGAPSLFDQLNEAGPSNSMLTPEVKDLLEMVDDHVAALENKEASQQFEDTIELDAIYAPLVAQGKK
jgi:small-conductance mechanosensitive channel